MWVSPNKPKHWSLEERKVYWRAMQGDKWLVIPTSLKYPKHLEPKFQSIFKGKVREGSGWLLQNSWWGNPFLQLSTEVRSGCSCKPPTRYMLHFSKELKQRIWGKSLHMGEGSCMVTCWPICISSLRKCLFSSSAHVLISFFCFFFFFDVELYKLCV